MWCLSFSSSYSLQRIIADGVCQYKKGKSYSIYEAGAAGLRDFRTPMNAD
jgi:hypothetical protein